MSFLFNFCMISCSEKMTAFENLTTSQKVRAAVHRDVRNICTETCHFLGLDITKPAMEIVAELLYKKISVYGTDLEDFAKHAKRTTINAEDVKLLVRRNPFLKAHLNSIAPNPPGSKEKRRKTVALPVARHPEAAFTSNMAEQTGKDGRPTGDEFVEDMAVDETVDLTFD